MPDFAYTRLTELDRSFLIYEGPNSPMHVGAVQIFDAAPLRSRAGPIDFERLLEYVASRVHRIPRYRQRVEPAPVGGHPIWIDDARFNLRYHVRHTRLPKPGDDRLLKRQCARILEQRLDLHKPPWEMWLVEGLGGDRVALVSKTHHCMIDGVSGVDLMSVLMTFEPLEKIDPPPVWLPRRAPTAVEYAASEAAARATAPLRAARSLARIVTDEGGARRDLVARLEAAGHVVASTLRPTTATPLNQPVGPHRRFDWLPMPLDEISLVRSRLGGTLNDVVLAVAAGGIRRFFKYTRLTDPDNLEFKVMAPVSVRDGGQRGKLGNRVSAWFVPLPIGERDPLARLAKVREATDALRRHHDALGAEAITQAVEWMGSTPIALGARLLETGQPPFHMVITNVPGPRVPLYLLGAKMLEAHPMVPLMGNLSVGIALFSYGGTLSWGFNADWEQVPDLHELVLAVQHSFAQLLERAKRAPEPPAAAAGAAEPRKTRKKAGPATGGTRRRRSAEDS